MRHLQISCSFFFLRVIGLFFYISIYLVIYFLGVLCLLKGCSTLFCLHLILKYLSLLMLVLVLCAHSSKLNGTKYSKACVSLLALVAAVK